MRPSGCVTGERYVRSMNDSPTIVAGEPLHLLERAFELLEFEVEDCGCIAITGRLPTVLHDTLLRALIDVECEMLAHGVEPYSGPGTDPLSELMVRVVAAGRSSSPPPGAPTK